MRPVQARLAAVFATSLAACSVESSKTRETASSGETDKTFKPTQYSVADFYANKEFFGASFSHDRQRVLVGSNSSGIWKKGSPCSLPH